MTIISSKKLAVLLTASGNEITPAEVRSSCEAYGTKVYAYLYPKQGQTLDEFKALLTKINVGYSTNYDGCAAEIRVGYFKANHWNE